MCCNLDRKALGRQQSLMSIGRGGLSGGEVVEGPVSTPKIPGCRVKDRILLGKSWGPTARVNERALADFGGFEYGTGEDTRGGCLLGCRRLGVCCVSKATTDGKTWSDEGGVDGANLNKNIYLEGL